MTLELNLDFNWEEYWLYLVIGITLLWYMITGYILKNCPDCKRDDSWFIFYLLLPVILAFMLAVCIVSMVLWVLTGGLVRPMWEWKS